ncbi:MAG: helix-turn-helix domain-containing protein, partial [Myxococcales bacterium]|nr:helix-turn-helix domain-containing protein [Myxococcales bacterium]
MPVPNLALALTVDELRALIREEVSAVAGPPGTADAAPEVMTREQAAKLLQVHPQVVGRYIRKEGLPATKIAGGEWRLLRKDVLAWV